MRILVTGAAGYIGIHTCVELAEAGFDAIIIDNFANSSPKALKRGELAAGKPFIFYEGDVRDESLLDKIFSENSIDAVIHFAALKAVGESCLNPLPYYENNLNATLALIKVMRKRGVGNLIFSSSATVYGMGTESPLKETAPLSVISPYGATKLICERIITDAYSAYEGFQPIILRYFNPVGAHESGLIGEAPGGIPNNLMPYIADVAAGKLEKLSVFGNDYPTPDGTCVRDYIHVADLAKGHIAALRVFEAYSEKGASSVPIYNLGTGQGYSVLEVVKAFGRAAGKEIPYIITRRRPGDAPACFADPSKAMAELGWRAAKTLDDMCADSWRWKSQNPDGY